jgi:hypothetical protein
MIYMMTRRFCPELDKAIEDLKRTAKRATAAAERPTAIGQRELQSLGGDLDEGKEVLSAFDEGRGGCEGLPRPASTEVDR